MNVVIGAVAVAAACAIPLPLGAWGMDVHRRLTGRAVDGLPIEVRRVFDARRDFVVEHSVDPDLWRVAGLGGPLGPESPNHYFEIDALEDRPAGTETRGDWETFVRAYGAERAERIGRLPWQAADIYRKLVTAWRQVGHPSSPYAADNTRYLAAIIAHYVEDAFVPFHAVVNYDGQRTNQTGIHARFETALALRYWDRLGERPVSIHQLDDVQTFLVETLVESASLASAVLDADRRANLVSPGYGEAYFAAFLDATGPILDARLTRAADAVASVLVAAWVDAGRPSGEPVRGLVP